MEATVTSLVGNAVRGAGVFGTNNETLATVIETAAGVIAKNWSSTRPSATSWPNLKVEDLEWKLTKVVL